MLSSMHGPRPSSSRFTLDSPLVVFHVTAKTPSLAGGPPSQANWIFPEVSIPAFTFDADAPSGESRSGVPQPGPGV